MDEATIKELSKRRIERWNLGNEEERKEALLVGRFLRNRSWPMVNAFIKVAGDVQDRTMVES